MCQEQEAFHIHRVAAVLAAYNIPLHDPLHSDVGTGHHSLLCDDVCQGTALQLHAPRGQQDLGKL